MVASNANFFDGCFTQGRHKACPYINRNPDIKQRSVPQANNIESPASHRRKSDCIKNLIQMRLNKKPEYLVKQPYLELRRSRGSSIFCSSVIFRANLSSIANVCKNRMTRDRRTCCGTSCRCLFTARWSWQAWRRY